MFLLNRLFSGWAMKRMWLICSFLLLGAAIWYLGPFFGFGEVRPLEGFEPRIVFLFLTLIIFLAIWFGVPGFIILAMIACASVWVFTPFILIGEKYRWPRHSIG
ncbi:Uncharacterised protein [Ewingella americana]|uniref:Uncharacterized protein n=1 Tax=Ewingella americana TaxID=41202 RepID=A0A377NE86_9GAMM|nr:Uncharacterised protein [Ewingella americana]